ncbi:RILP-like protein-like [Papilio machaon]|uniref:RILP-like protein-like n=1 Tax=Papilio machaon TaxID=76193 RepID=A0A194R195_PAPMA|nr:RILP-like protein-like [Papilio machaon]
MTDYDDDITVVDVYDLASDIGKECEIIIEKYGPDAVTALLPKVINALELLENFAVRNEKENQSLLELTAKISQLENDKIEKAEYRQRFEKHGLTMALSPLTCEGSKFHPEDNELISYDSLSLKKELRAFEAPKSDEHVCVDIDAGKHKRCTSAPPSPAREHDQEVLSRLSSTAEKQRATLRHQEVQLQEKQQLIESVSTHHVHYSLVQVGSFEKRYYVVDTSFIFRDQPCGKNFAIE